MGVPGTMMLAHGETVSSDILFVAGADWRSLSAAQCAGEEQPVFNLIQGFRAVRAGSPLHGFLANPAIRICVSPELAQAAEENGVSGPLFTIPVGLDRENLPPPLPPEERDIDCLVLAVKAPVLGGKIARRIERRRHRVLLVKEPMPRPQLLDAMARARVAVHLPGPIEGAYLPALESMALGAAVVCPDCVGNRSFCRDGETCFVPRRRERAIANAARSALAAREDELAPLLARAQAQSARHDLANERARFLELLERTEALWETR